jgi:hypothetical protein
VLSQIEVGDVGTAKALRVHLQITNSNMATVTVTLFDPAGFEHILWAQNGPGTGLTATYPAPDAPVAGNLTSWHGQNAQGEWILKVVDDGFLNNELDGAIDAWSVEIDAVSHKTVAVDGDLVVTGAITGPSGIVVGAGTAPCDPAHAGAIQFDPASKRLTFCTGDELLQLRACSPTCPLASEVGCGAAIETDCGVPCPGTGSATDSVQCLSNVSTTHCGQPVLDACDNVCGTTGTALDLASCPEPDDVACGQLVLDPCGNVCGTTGDQCSGSALCVEGSCLELGQSAQAAGLSCQDILNQDPSATHGVYWLDPDGAAGEGPFEVWCDMDSETGWNLAYVMCQDGGGDARSSGLVTETPITPTAGTPVSSLGYDRVLALEPTVARFTSTHVGGTGYLLSWANMTDSWNPAQVLLDGTMGGSNADDCHNTGPALAGSTGTACPGGFSFEHNNHGGETHDIPTLACGCHVWNVNPQGMLWGQIDTTSNFNGVSHHLGQSGWDHAPASTNGCILMYVR